MKKIVITLLPIVFFVGCSIKNVHPLYSRSELVDKTLVVMSISYDIKLKDIEFNKDDGYFTGWRNPEVILQNLSNKEWYRIQSAPYSSLMLFESKSHYENKWGKLIVVEVAAGVYRVPEWRISWGNSLYTVKPFFEPSYKFEPGEIVYLGEYQIDIHFGKDKYGYVRKDDMTIAISNKYERDIQLVDKMYENLKGEKIQNVFQEAPKPQSI